MHPFEVLILGSGAALPARGRHPSAQLLNADGSLYLIDCGEGTQMRLRQFGVSIQKIDHVFISHLHGDHYLGLVGLLSTLHLMGREKDFHVHGPSGVQEIVEVQFKASATFLKFPLHFHVVEGKEIWSDGKVEVEHLPLKHRITCHGFLFREKPRAPKIKKEAIKQYGLSVPNILDLKAGKDIVTSSGARVIQAIATEPPMAPRSYAYCSDTAYNESLVDRLAGCDLLYHEATFTNELKKRAKETYHSTAKQAAMIASKAQVGQLLIGHFSSRYKDLSVLLDEAKEIFSNTSLAEEGELFPVRP